MSITHLEVRRHPVWRDEVAAPAREHPHGAGTPSMAFVTALVIVAIIAGGIALALR